VLGDVMAVGSVRALAILDLYKRAASNLLPLV